MQDKPFLLTISIVPMGAPFIENYDYEQDLNDLVEAFCRETQTPQASVYKQDNASGIVRLLLPGQQELTPLQEHWQFSHTEITGYEAAPFRGDSMYRGHALNADLQPVYQQACEELEQFGKAQDRYYCRRLDRYVSEQDVNKVAALEDVLWRLEEATDKTHALELLGRDLPSFIDRPTHGRYVELVKQVEHRASGSGAYPEDTKFWYPRG